MDLNELAQYFRHVIGGSGESYRDPSDPSTSYGPAMSRIGKVPIQFSPTSDTGGQYDPSILSLITPLSMHRYLTTGHGQITINPFDPDIKTGPGSQSTVGDAVRHEDIHAVLDPLGQDRLAEMVRNNPYYDKVVKDLKVADRLGSGPLEVPAYIGENRNWSSYGQLWMDQFMQMLQKENPSIAKQYSQLSRYTTPGVSTIPGGTEANAR